MQGEARMAEKQQTNDSGNGGEPFKRWTAKRKAAVVLDLIKGKTTPTEVARQHDLTVADVEKWLDTFAQAGEEALRSNPRERDEQHEAERNRLHAKIGELTLELDVEKKRVAAVLRGSVDETS
jgi:transposase-like protein